MLADVIDHLICPVCGTGTHLAEGAVRCERGHSFDVARQGYVNMLTGSAPPGTADTAEMVAARADFLEAGHFAPLADRLAALCRQGLYHQSPHDPHHQGLNHQSPHDPHHQGLNHQSRGGQALDSERTGVVVDAGAGTGHYLAGALGDRAVGIALDVSKHALRRAARAHPRIGAVVADVWRPLPVRADTADVVLNVFAPRNAAEFARILRPGGMLVVATPGPGHLRPLVDRLGLLTVDEDKERRLEETLGGRFALAVRDEVEITLSLGHEAVRAVVGMGPSAWHTRTGDLAAKTANLPDPVQVTAAFRITGWLVQK